MPDFWQKKRLSLGICVFAITADILRAFITQNLSKTSHDPLNLLKRKPCALVERVNDKLCS